MPDEVNRQPNAPAPAAAEPDHAGSLLREYRLDRTALSVGTLDDDDARDYWRRQSPEQRMRALEFLRQVHYGYDPATTRLQRVLEIVELGED